MALSAIATTSSGGTPSRKNPEYYGGDIPWVKIGDLNDGLVSSTETTITAAGLAASSAKILPAGTLLVAMYGSIGKLGILGMEAATNQAICAIACDPAVALTEYVFWVLARDRQSLTRLGRGGTQLNIGQGDLRRWSIPLPPLVAQAKIVDRLAADLAAIARATEPLGVTIAQIRRLRSVARLRAFDVEAKTSPLADLATIQSGLTKSAAKASDTAPVPYLSTANVQAGRLDLTRVKTIRATAAQQQKHRLAVGDVLVLEGGDADKVGRGWIWDGAIDGCLHQNHVFAVRADPSVLDPRYLAHFINSPRARQFFLSQAKQTTGIASINKSQLRDMPVPVPPLGAQRLAVARLDALLAQADLLERRVQEAETLSATLRLSVLHQACG